MGSGCPAAKKASKMILVDDNILSILNAVLWGRNIYSNVRKFLQYQLTFNITTVLIVFMGAIFRGATIFSAIQLLWMNIIMDTLAAIALAAERPHPRAIKEKPFREGLDNIITYDMQRMIAGMTIYISSIMFIMFWFNEDIWGFTYTMSDPLYDKDGNSTYKCKAFTMLFNLFIWLHIFNLFACRDINWKRYNPFLGLTHNFFFIAVFFAIIGIQLVMVEWGDTITQTSGLEQDEHCVCIIVGSTSLIASFIIRKLPEKLFALVPLFDDKLLKEPPEDKLSRIYNKMEDININDKINGHKKEKNIANAMLPSTTTTQNQPDYAADEQYEQPDQENQD